MAISRQDKWMTIKKKKEELLYTQEGRSFVCGIGAMFKGHHNLRLLNVCIVQTLLVVVFFFREGGLSATHDTIQAGTSISLCCEEMHSFREGFRRLLL